MATTTVQLIESITHRENRITALFTYLEKVREMINGLRVTKLYISESLYADLTLGGNLEAEWRGIAVGVSSRKEDPSFSWLCHHEYDISDAPYVYRNRDGNLVSLWDPSIDGTLAVLLTPAVGPSVGVVGTSPFILNAGWTSPQSAQPAPAVTHVPQKRKPKQKKVVVVKPQRQQVTRKIRLPE